MLANLPLSLTKIILFRLFYKRITRNLPTSGLRLVRFSAPPVPFVPVIY